MPVVFPIHPRTEASMQRSGLSFTSPGMRVLEPLGYVEFLSLVQDSAGVLTDSGGMQEETTYLGIPCFTLRDNTERPITCELGTNVLLGLAPERITEVPGMIAQTRDADGEVPPGWDGAAAERLVDVLLETNFGESSGASGRATRLRDGTALRIVTPPEHLERFGPRRARPRARPPRSWRRRRDRIGGARTRTTDCSFRGRLG